MEGEFLGVVEGGRYAERGEFEQRAEMEDAECLGCGSEEEEQELGTVEWECVKPREGKGKGFLYIFFVGGMGGFFLLFG